MSSYSDSKFLDTGNYWRGKPSPIYYYILPVGDN